MLFLSVALDRTIGLVSYISESIPYPLRKRQEHLKHLHASPCSCLFLIDEVKTMNGNDTSLSTIKELFYRQIKELTLRTCKADTFDIQFSDRWL